MFRDVALSSSFKTRSKTKISIEGNNLLKKSFDKEVLMSENIINVKQILKSHNILEKRTKTPNLVKSYFTKKDFYYS